MAEAGVLVAKVRAVKDMGSQHFVLLDAGFNDLMRPAMYGSYLPYLPDASRWPGVGAATAARNGDRWPTVQIWGCIYPAGRGGVETTLTAAGESGRLSGVS